MSRAGIEVGQNLGHRNVASVQEPGALAGRLNAAVAAFRHRFHEMEIAAEELRQAVQIESGTDPMSVAGVEISRHAGDNGVAIAKKMTPLAGGLDLAVA